MADANNRVQGRTKRLKLNTSNFKEGMRVKNTTVMFVPSTPESKLFDMVQVVEEEVSQSTQWGTKLIERPGIPLVTKFRKTFPMEQGCARGKMCPMCEDDSKGCTSKRVVYQASCKICQESHDEILEQLKIQSLLRGDYEYQCQGSTTESLDQE